MNRRKRHPVKRRVVPLHVEVRQERDVREERLEAALVAGDLRGDLLDVREAVFGLRLVPRLAQVVLVEEVAEVLDQFADLVRLQVVVGGLDAFRERRPERTRLGAEKAAERVAAFLRASVEAASELFPVALRALLADARQELDEAQERKLVRRVQEQPQVGEDVLDVDLLEDADAGGDPEGDFHPGERHLDVDGLEVAAVEHGHVAVAVAERTRLGDESYDFAGHRLAVVDPVDGRLLAAAAAVRAQGLLELARRVLHHDVRDVEDFRHGAVVALELDRAAALPAARELHDVLDLGPAPRVDALEVVADGEDVAVLRREDVRELGLEPVRVLVLVDEDVEEVLLEHLAHARRPRVGQETEAVHEQVVEVHRAELALARLVFRGDLGDLLRVDAGRLRLPAPSDVDDGAPLVRGLGDHLRDELLLHEVLRVRDGRLDQLAEELLLVVLVEDLEAGRIAEARAVAAQEARADRVERPRPDGRDGVADEGLGPLAHLARGAVREGQQEDAVRRDAALDQVGDAVDERAGLAGAGRREHEQRPVAGRRRRALFGIEEFREVCHGFKRAYNTISAA